MRDRTWRKSSYSNNLECVEVALSPNTTAIRDSKDPHGPHLSVTAQQWQHFLARIGHNPLSHR